MASIQSNSYSPKQFNRSSFTADENELIQTMFQTICNKYSADSDNYKITLHRADKHYSGYAYLNSFIIHIRLPNSPWCAEEVKFILEHELLHTFGVSHKNYPDYLKDFPCICRSQSRQYKYRYFIDDEMPCPFCSVTNKFFKVNNKYYKTISTCNHFNKIQNTWECCRVRFKYLKT